MWYLTFIIMFLAIIFLSSSTEIRYIYDDGMKIEIHFVFFSLHFSKGKKKTRKIKISPTVILRIAKEILQNSKVTVKRLSIPISTSAKFLGINISYPLIYAYLTANSQKLIISENAVIREPSGDFKFLVYLSLKTATVNLVRPLIYMLFTAHRKREA